MQLGMIGLGRMGGNMARRLLGAGHECVVFDTSSQAVEGLVHEKALGAVSLQDLVRKLEKPRAVWMMVPAAVVDVKMVHNGIEYGLMAAYAEGLNILRGASVGTRGHDVDAETTPLRDPERYQYEFGLADIAELWRRGSVVSSWLLDLTASAIFHDPKLERFAGRVSDSGEGRWTIQASVDEGVPSPVLTAALYQRFASRGEADFADKVLSAMRHAFGGHEEKKS